jgi:multidrug efflux system membrane fusion protein
MSATEDAGSPVARLARRPAVVAGLLLALVALWLGSGLVVPRKRPVDEPAPATRATVATPVQVTSIAAEDVERVVVVSGRTAPARTVEVKAETSGRVVATGAARGSRVESGALLVRLDPGDRYARLEQAKAVLRQRELEYEGQLKLKPQGYISDAKLAESRALLESARAELARADLDIQRMDIRAPFAGALQDRRVEVGDYVAVGTSVATFVDERRLTVAGSVAESQIAGVRAGMPGSARLATGLVAPGRVRYVAPVADESTRTFAVELEIDNPRGELPIGVTADIELPVGLVRAHPISPALLTLDDAGVVGVKTVGADQRVQFLPATVVRSSANGVWISGLPDPARVIVGGQGFVRAGDVVTIAAPLAAAAQTATPPATEPPSAEVAR